MNLTYRYRVKNHVGLLNKHARAVNFVWNFANDRQREAQKWCRKWLTGFDIDRLTSGSSKELGISADTITQIGIQYARSRKQNNRPWLKYRGRKSLGWIPIRGRELYLNASGFRYYGVTYKVFLSRPLPAGAKIVDGCSFSQDARGNWYVNVCVELPNPEQRPVVRSVGVDLGLKDLAALSTGETIANPRHFGGLEERLGSAQRAGKKRLARTIHAKIQARRRDSLHKLSHRIVRDFDYIAVGNVNAAGLAKTSMAKSVNDAGWSTFRYMLAYKSIRNGAVYEEVDEWGSTRVCSSCGCETGPKGVADLGIRQWSCGDCGAVHNRDTNAAINILVRSGHRSLVEGAAANVGGNAKLSSQYPTAPRTPT